MSFPIEIQLNTIDCGPVCLSMICKYYGKAVPIDRLKLLVGQSAEGTSLLGLQEGAVELGLKATAVQIPFEVILEETPFPMIIFWEDNHYVVLYSLKGKKLVIADPAHGRLKMNFDEFKKYTTGTGEKVTGLIFEPTEDFSSKTDFYSKKSSKNIYSVIRSYLNKKKSNILELSAVNLLTSLLVLLIPLLTRMVVDYGVTNNDLNFILIILCSQLVIYFGKSIMDLIRNLSFFHFSKILNISLASEYFSKILNLPFPFFETRFLGDLLQRLSDHNRIQEFVSNTISETIFSFLNLVILSITIFVFSPTIFFVFLGFTLIYLVWITVLNKKRKIIDYHKFKEEAKSQSIEIHLLQGIKDIKLNGAELSKKEEWELNQFDLFKTYLKGLKIENFQTIGGRIINESKNLLIIYLSAREVISGSMTLGMMLAISQIIGMLNVPILNLLSFFRKLQDSGLSTERINEIYSEKNEKNDEGEFLLPKDLGDIVFQGVSFSYGKYSQKVLDNINLTIKKGETTAIVGESGCGKSTILKLIMGFHYPTKGEIYINRMDVTRINLSSWRKYCGVVMQDGYIFPDTVEKNISLSKEEINIEQIQLVSKLANIDEFFSSLPKEYKTKIGDEGLGLSEGQKQRLLIARAILKDPEYLFLDEATSSLDNINETKISESIFEFGKNRTVIIVAHRLSTIMKANKIVFLKDGSIAEAGTHQELMAKKGNYYDLVKGQIQFKS